MWVVEHHRSIVVEQRVAAGSRAVQIELGVADDRDPVRIQPGIVDQAAADLRPRDQHMIERRARLVEPDRAVAGAVAGVDDLQPVQPVARLEHERGLLRDDEHVEPGEEIEIVAIHQQLGRRQDRLGGAREQAAAAARQAEHHQPYLAPDRRAAQADHLGAQPVVSDRADHLDTRAGAGERQRDRQAVRDLVDLIMIEKETNLHGGGTPPIRRTRTA